MKRRVTQQDSATEGAYGTNFKRSLRLSTALLSQHGTAAGKEQTGREAWPFMARQPRRQRPNRLSLICFSPRPGWQPALSRAPGRLPASFKTLMTLARVQSLCKFHTTAPKPKIATCHPRVVIDTTLAGPIEIGTEKHLSTVKAGTKVRHGHNHPSTRSLPAEAAHRLRCAIQQEHQKHLMAGTKRRSHRLGRLSPRQPQ